MADIQCKNLKKMYGSVEVVSDFNLHVNDHEFLVFLGPSGCGKSTILRMFAGLEDITAGELLIGGKVVNDVEPGERGIAMVFQNYALYPHMSIRDNVAFGLRRLKIPEIEIEKRIVKVTEMLGLGSYLDRKPTELSGGQQQRVAIARAMIKTPEVFLFDEPLSNLDAKLRAHMRYEIAQLHKELKTTTVYVTHDQMEAMTLADRIVLLNAGEIEQVGTPEEIYERPASLFVAGFIGTPAMNFMDMEVQKNVNGWALIGDECSLDIKGDIFDLTDKQKIVLGMRPSKFTISDQNTSHTVLSGNCDLVEFHGDQVLVGFNIETVRLTAFVDASHRPNEGDKVSFEIKESDMHVFDSRSGLSARKIPVS
tara:strand:+ start:457 stop:1554 length:1098 start_codon:yes stop_codon:yes gene_type:complete